MKRPIALPISLALVAGCGTSGDDHDDDDGGHDFPQCMSAEYIAFDPANHANQNLRVAAYDDMLARMKEAEMDPAAAPAKVAEARALYQDTADLRGKVMGRIDPHDGRPIGAELDAAIIEGFDQGATATTALALNLARQKVDKTLIHFFYLSVFYELTVGARKEWDEGFGYYNGGSTTNEESKRKGLAAVATKRDATNNTNLAETIFNGVVDGSCELAKALHEASADELDYRTVPALQSVIDQVDLDMQKVLAYSAGHEAFEMVELQGDLSTVEARNEMWIKLAELDPYFKGVEPYMAPARAQPIRAAIDAAWADRTGAWMSAFPAQMIVEELEADFSIDIRG
jgi:hypothetical protein